MNHGSLFSGIGGFDLAAEWMGWNNVFHCEWNPFGQKVLKHYWPNAKSYSDITKTDFTVHRGAIDLISGGFPCQPYSMARKRKGKEDERHLWPQMLRAIREVAPRWVVGENVYGLVNWSGGLVFHEVQADLEAEGYEVQPFLLPACAVNAPHRRDRIWFVAYRNSARFQTSRTEQQTAWIEQYGKLGGIASNSDNTGDTSLRSQDQQEWQKGSNEWREPLAEFSRLCSEGTAADTRNQGLQGSKINGSITAIWKNGNEQPSRFFRSTWKNFPTVSPIRFRNDGIPIKLYRYIKSEFYGTIREENRIKNMSEMWNKVSQTEIWEQIRRFYSLESKEVLFQTMQLYQTGSKYEGELSPFSEKVSEPIMLHLSKYGQFRSSPQGQELEKQRQIQFGDTLSFLPHEVALAARRFETQLSKFEAWHRQESIKAGGNAIVPQLALQIFKTIQQYENTPLTTAAAV